MYKPEMFLEYEPKSCKEVYSVINARQITALMFHDEMADLFDFLGLRGFKEMHEHQYLSESIEHRRLKGYFLNHNNMLLSTEELSPVDVVPDDWYKYTRTDVTSSIRKQAVQNAMVQYKEWEVGTKELYQKCASYLLSWHKVSDFNRVNELVAEVDAELESLERLCLELRAIDFDMPQIVSMQDEYYNLYRERTENIGKSV